MSSHQSDYRLHTRIISFPTATCSEESAGSTRVVPRWPGDLDPVIGQLQDVFQFTEQALARFFLRPLLLLLQLLLLLLVAGLLLSHLFDIYQYRFSDRCLQLRVLLL